MITVSRFTTSIHQDENIQLSKPEVPLFWGGYYAIYKPNNGSVWTKKWHQTNKGKTIAKAFKIVSIGDAHEIWNNFLNHKN